MKASFGSSAQERVTKMKRTLVCLMVVAVCLAAESSWADPIQVPENGALYGTIPWTEVTWGGTGIPTDYSAYREISASGVTIHLAMRAHGRYAYHAGVYQDPSEPIYYVETGKYGGDGLGKDYAKWNFAWYVAISSTPDATANRYTVKLFYDFDPETGTDESAHGVIIAQTISSSFTYQDSWNLGMDFLNGEGQNYVPNYIMIMLPATRPFNPNVNGEYTFRLAVYKDSSDLGGVSIKVNAVPEPTSMVALSSLGLIGGVWGVVRRRKRSQV